MMSTVTKNTIERENLTSLEGIDIPGDKVIKLEIGAVKLPKLEFSEYQPGLRKGVQIYALFDNTKEQPPGSDLAIIKYEAGAFVPLHLHLGHEMVLVLEGEYVENDVLYRPGALIVRVPGSKHEMRSDVGCTILAMRDVPVKQLT
jgi:hypothetical protein